MVFVDETGLFIYYPMNYPILPSIFGMDNTQIQTTLSDRKTMDSKNNPIASFLWNLSGFKKDIISTSRVDSYHATIIGTLLCMVGLYASLAWTFFFQTMTTQIWMPVIAGVFMGMFILCFDRALIASLSAGNTNIYSIGFRLLLSALLGIFLAQPMILKFYEHDITREAQILVDKKNQERKKELESIYTFEMNQLSQQKKEYEQQLKNKADLMIQAQTDFTNEMDGSGGTGRWGYHTVSREKEKILTKHREEYESLRDTIFPKITDIQKKIDAVHDKIAADFESYRENNTAFGTLIQAEALESLLTKDKTGTLRTRYYLLAVILALIELSALIAKMLFQTKSYRSKVNQITETEVKKAEHDKEITLAKLDEYKKQALDHELAILHKFFNETKDVNQKKLDEMVSDWKSDGNTTYKDVWELYKKKFMIHE